VTHVCRPPAMQFGLTVPLQPDWTCAKCGRMWRDCGSGSIRWWAEVLGPILDEFDDRDPDERLTDEYDQGRGSI
jgi:hypothetical protein